jgi:hypothetical protein
VRRNNLWLCFPLAVTGLGDGVLTLVGTKLWGWEMNPIWRWFLQRSDVAFGFAFAGYLVVIGTIVAYSPLRLSKVLCITMVLAHTNGVLSWLHLAGLRYFLDPFVYAFIAVITVIAVEQGAGPNSRPPSQLSRSPEIPSSDSQRRPSSGGCG